MVNELRSTASVYVTMPHGRTSGAQPLPTRRQDGIAPVRPSPIETDVRISGRLPGHELELLRSGEAKLSTAQAVRQADDSLRKVDAILAEIHSKLLHIVKQYPPFGLDNPERIRYLQALAGLRKQLDAMEFPPRRQDAGLPVIDTPDRAAWRPPELDPESATDAQLHTALDFIISARDTLRASQARMWQEVVSYLGPDRGQEVAHMVQTVRGLIADHPGNALGMDRRWLVELGE
ncbi:MAG TPA: hypothetical protein PKH69_11805 [Thiobacillaceae bacterium]|nr:hypothetical protein [Thiobacillaceae bacterium]HNU65123.1 hypothetical protein [Thiobacillaceae bacterium]